MGRSRLDPILPPLDDSDSEEHEQTPYDQDHADGNLGLYDEEDLDEHTQPDGDVAPEEEVTDWQAIYDALSQIPLVGSAEDQYKIRWQRRIMASEPDDFAKIDEMVNIHSGGVRRDSSICGILEQLDRQDWWKGCTHGRLVRRILPLLVKGL